MNRNTIDKTSIDEKIRRAIHFEKFEDAISSLSNIICTEKDMNKRRPYLLLRGESFIGLSKKYTTTPATRSELSPYFGLDPKQLAELAVRDLTKFSASATFNTLSALPQPESNSPPKSPTSTSKSTPAPSTANDSSTLSGPQFPKTLTTPPEIDIEDEIRYYVLLGTAYFLLEKFFESRECYLKGLDLSPFDQTLQQRLQEVDKIFSDSSTLIKKPRLTSTPKSSSSSSSDILPLSTSEDLDCTLCLRLLYDPITTPCGHTFCRECLERSLDRATRCPLCRALLFLNLSSHPQTHVLHSLISRLFPEETSKRKAELSNSPSGKSADSRLTLPLFVMDIVLPQQKVFLNIFEPRYRLMTRRCLESDRVFAMVGYDRRSREIYDVACEVEIIDCVPQTDGRFYLEVHGRRRVRIENSWEVDGYRVGHVIPFEDDKIAPDKPEAHDRLSKVIDQAQSLWDSVEDTSCVVSSSEHPLVPREQPEKFSFCLANVLPFSSQQRLDLLRQVDTERRFVLSLDAYRSGQTESVGPFGCDFQ
eukprot:TRINITY_DN12964_c0_g1_i1.p1 TRINITY_DN12964_c0_g1~~TRINITY_DN12964_c0_g1_i1.p1  ORF type:complete len:533 (-),score=105.10 TRINITY_DN12964_c0_g1_i1:110-1708(-)